MAGIYIHIPYCKKACHYCNFHFSTTKYNMDEMLQAICKEMDLRKNYLSENIETIYFGGGTPSIVQPNELNKIMVKIYQLFSVCRDAEITLEANPDDVSAENLQAWKNIGVNRLSIGIQSFHQPDLEWMNRAHSATQAVQSIKAAQQAGFSNLTCDLIYGTPLLTDEKWLQNLEQIKQLNVPHLSAYALTVEPKTALYAMIEKRKVENIDAEKQTRQFDMLTQWAQANNFEHYEISNFALKGFRSKHNSSYWQGKNYIGFGAAAHSFDGNSRQWNIANNALYIRSLQNNSLNFEKEILTIANKINEAVMLSLRTMEGIDLEKIEKNFGMPEKQRLLRIAKKWMQKNQLAQKNNHLILTPSGKHFADGIAADFFV